MTWTLLRKELHQHWLGLSAVLLAGGLSLLLILAASLARGDTHNPFEALRFYTGLMSLLGALVLNHRLIVLEYQARTQLFLEGLPLARWRMVAVKYGLGLGTLLGLVGAAWALTCLLAGRHEGLTLRYATLLLARAASVAWLVHAFCFLMGLTGRYRLALYLVLLLSCVILSEHTALDLSRFGPVALLDSRFAYEREVVPWQALGVTWVLSGIFTLLAAGLSLIREGSIAALLAEKMSHREKVFIAASLCGLLFAASTLGEKIKKAPFDLRDAATAQQAGVTVKVASGAGEEDPQAVRLAKVVVGELAALQEYLGRKNLPPVFIVRGRDLDANRFERGELAKSEGVHVRANFTSAAWQDEAFLAWLVPEVLTVASHGRAELESKRWVLDGFGLYWTGRDHAEAELGRDSALALRSLYGTEPGFSAVDLRRWLVFRERVGNDIAAGVAWSGLKTLARRQGPERCRGFLRSVLGNEEPTDFRACFFSRSWERPLQVQTGQSAEAFLRQWQEELAGARAVLAGQLAAIPRLSGKVSFVPLSADSRKAQYDLRIEPVPASEARYSFYYRQLSALNEEVESKGLRRELRSLSEGSAAELPETYSRGQRLYWSFALDVQALGCQVVSGFIRQEVP